MAINMSMGMRLEQRLKMTAQMIQSIEMLQLPLMELEQQINQHLAENPALEIEEVEADSDAEEFERQERDEQTDFERLDEISRDEEWEEALYSSGSSHVHSGEEDPKLSAMQNTAARSQTLQEHMLDQLHMSDAAPRIREVVEAMVYALDDNGYLLMPLEEIFQTPEGEDPEPPAPVSPEEAAEALRVIQNFDPVGVGARTVEECLLFQLERSGEDHEFEKRLLALHFDDVLHNRLPKVAQDMGATIERIKQAIAVIAQLNPRPGRDYDSNRTQFILPDVVIAEDGVGGYTVRLNDGRLPPLRISPVYRELAKREKRGSAARDYLRDKIQSAKWLIDSIEQRRTTLLKIANEVATAQVGFLSHGVSHLKPLMMQDVAADIGMHVSTVSRAISDKYADTPQGIYPLRYFFTGGYKTSGGLNGDDSISNRTVMNRIQEMVKVENKKRPLSDAEIAKMLQKEGIDIARRTVAKYREKLNVPASRQRKEY